MKILYILPILALTLLTKKLHSQQCVQVFGVTQFGGLLEPARIDTEGGDFFIQNSLQVPGSIKFGGYTVDVLNRVQYLLTTDDQLLAIKDNQVETILTNSELKELVYDCVNERLLALQIQPASQISLTGILPNGNTNIIATFTVSGQIVPNSSSWDSEGQRYYFLSKENNTIKINELDVAAGGFQEWTIADLTRAMTWDKVQGRLIMLTEDFRLFQFDPATGEETFVADLPITGFDLYLSNLCIDPFTQELFFLTENTSGQYFLHECNAVSGALAGAALQLPYAVHSIEGSKSCTPRAEFSFSGTFCPGSTVEFEDLSLSALSWSWDFGDPDSGSANFSDEQNPTHLFMEGGSYEVRLTISGCESDDIFVQSIEVPENISNFLPQDTVRNCTGELAAEEIPGATYLWNNGETASANTISNTGITWLDITVQGCTFRDSTYFELVENMGQSIELTSSNTLCVSDGTVTILSPNNVSAEVEFLWSTGSTDHFIEVVEPATYSLEVTYADGCKADASIEVVSACESAYYAPNAFSPNGDGINDHFTLFGKGFREIGRLMVFDRWGGLVFEGRNLPLNQVSAGWNGKYNKKSKLAGVGTYLYFAELVQDDGTEVIAKGEINLIR